MSADRGYTTKGAEGFAVPPSQLTKGRGNPTKPKAGKSSMPSARSIDSIVDCVDAMLPVPSHVDESTHGAGGRSGVIEINYIRSKCSSHYRPTESHHRQSFRKGIIPVVVSPSTGYT